jgi:alpha-glucoside transport system substrate-binding protein
VDYGGTDQFETVINVQVESGSTPDVAAVPQPGLIARLAQEGAILPVPDEIAALYDTNYSPAWKALATIDGKIYGVFTRVNAKGLVYYNKPAFEAKYKVPTSWAELEALEQQMIKDGTPPWCVTMESGAATGWVGTDWIENIVLRTQPVEKYDQWVAHKLVFNSPEVKNAWTIMDKRWGDPKMVYGGKKYIGTAVWNQAAKDLFASPPKCWMLLQGNFITGFMPDDVQKDLDNRVAMFPLPMIDTSLPPTLEIGGDQWVMFRDSPAIRKWMAFVASAASAEPWAKAGGALFPQKGQDMSWYKSKVDQTLVQSLINVQAARFDGSDAMVSAGNVAFWKAVTDYVGGMSIDDALKEIDAAWPTQ